MGGGSSRRKVPYYQERDLHVRCKLGKQGILAEVIGGYAVGSSVVVKPSPPIPSEMKWRRGLRIGLPKHKNVADIVGVVCSDNGYKVMWEYVQGGSVKDLLDARNETEKIRMKMAVDLVRGVEFLHNRLNLVIKTLKPENLLFDGDTLKITDYNLLPGSNSSESSNKSKSNNTLSIPTSNSNTSNQQEVHAPVGEGGLTPRQDEYHPEDSWISDIHSGEYRPPELLKNDQKLTTRADIYSLGMCLSFVWFRTPKGERAQLREEFMLVMLERCLQHNPQNRPDASQILEVLLDKKHDLDPILPEGHKTSVKHNHHMAQNLEGDPTANAEHAEHDAHEKRHSDEPFLMGLSMLGSLPPEDMGQVPTHLPEWYVKQQAMEYDGLGVEDHHHQENGKK
mmetsp:Transcript_22797/g.40362  ORF Transcript_22797/g.40362 Transcript_22797/m.40362 type:complete len:394 (+) Transcript_22797:265-1446(+)|eukprot:CAMPEP_0197514810 /NCGR_PEP_ID=MMETSP1318-20131121/138_1 /TAXON_ID=552666 /ORGANISM="Partenskyella glossopodia, Strain RCC365" /LENGTH=393 /DNA_ID=CAMNT_0043063007 /DNA_START=213 /DNA_END=1394 /DNA_ORIENTATION=+